MKTLKERYSVYLHTLTTQTIIANTSKRVYTHAEKQEQKIESSKSGIEAQRESLYLCTESGRERSDMHLAHTRGRQRRERKELFQG